MSRFLVFAFFMFVLSGCKKNEYLPDDDRYALLSIAPVINKGEATIAHQDNYIDNFKIGIQVTNSNGTELYFPYTANLLLSYGVKWVLSKPVCLSVKQAKIFAYYPFTELEGQLSGTGETAAVKINIPKVQEMALQTDYMYSSQSTFLPNEEGPIFYANPNVTLELSHALSLISFVIFKEDFTGAGSLTKIVISDNSDIPGLTANISAGNNPSMRLADGLVLNGSPSADISVDKIDNTITETIDPGEDDVLLKTLVNGYVYVVPSNFKDKRNVQFSLTIDNEVYTISHSGEGELVWLKGFQYIYILRLTKTAISIVDIIITDWDSGFVGEIILESQKIKT